MGKRNKKWGDRPDGYWLKDLDVLHIIMPHIYNRRTESEVFVKQEFDITELLKYIEVQNKKHPEFKTTPFHAILLGFAKVLYHRPLLNRFIAAGRMYQREKIDVAFMVKKQFDDHAEEAMLKEVMDPKWNLEMFSEYLFSQVKKAKSGKDNSTEDIMALLAKLPRPILSFVAWVIRTLDTFGKLPKSITQGDINYSSAILTNLGSIKAPAIYHHLSEYGTTSLIIAIGTITKKPVFKADGSLKEYRDVVDMGITIDERMADGFYFSQSLKLMDKLFSNPKLFDQAIEEIIND